MVLPLTCPHSFTLWLDFRQHTVHCSVRASLFCIHCFPHFAQKAVRRKRLLEERRAGGQDAMNRSDFLGIPVDIQNACLQPNFRQPIRQTFTAHPAWPRSPDEAGAVSCMECENSVSIALHSPATVISWIENIVHVSTSETSVHPIIDYTPGGDLLSRREAVARENTVIERNSGPNGTITGHN